MSVALVGPVLLCANAVSGVVLGWSYISVGSLSIGISYESTMIGLTVTWV